MLKFFRSIRQKLLAEDERSEALTQRTAKRAGRLSKYLVYAIGEIALVVIGILIALQVNTWNEERKAVKLAQSFLMALREDLYLDLETLQTYEELLDLSEKSGFNVWNYLYNDGVGVDTSRLSRDFLELHLFREFSPTQMAYDNLINSGGINLLQDTQLPRLLATFHRENDSVISAKAQRNRLADQYDPYRVKYISPLMLRDFLSEKLLDQPGFDRKGHKIDWVNLQKDQGYKDLLDQILAMRVPVRNMLRIHRENIGKILTEIDKLTKAK